MLRIVLGTMAGVVLALLAIMTLETVSHQIFPLPPGADISDPETLKTLVGRMPLAAQAFVVAGWAIGAALGGVVANLIARQPWPALVVGGAIAASVVLNMTMLPHPLWMQVAGVLAPLLVGVVIFRTTGPRQPPA